MLQLHIRTGAPRHELVETTVVDVALHDDIRRRRRVVRGLLRQDPVALLRVAGPVVEAYGQRDFVAIRFCTGRPPAHQTRHVRNTSHGRADFDDFYK